MIAVDVETTGLDPKMCSIVSVGAVDLDDPINQFYDECRIWEGAHITDEALAVNDLSREDLGPESGRKTEAELIRAFIAWAFDRPKSHTFVGQNITFDRDFIEAACKRTGVEFPFAHRTLDTHTLAWYHHVLRGIEPPTKHGRSAINLDYLLEYCGMPPEPRPHNALTGALSHAETFSRIVYAKKILSEFNEYDIPWQINKDITRRA